MSFAGFNTI